MKLSAKDLLELKVIDEIIPEPIGGAHRDKNSILNNVRKSILKNLETYKDVSNEEILNQRKNKFLQIGRGKGFIDNPDVLSDLHAKNNNLNQFFKSKSNIILVITSALLIIASLIIFL